MSIILNSILPLFLLIALGVVIKLVQNIQHPTAAKICSLTGHCDDKWSEVLNKSALYIALPALILHSLANTPKAELVGRDVMLMNVILLAVFFVTILIIGKISNTKKEIVNTYAFCAFFGNVAYIGLPFILSLRPGAAGATSVLIAVHIAIAFTLGLYVLERSKHKNVELKTIAKRVITNPLIIAVVVGFLFLYSGIRLPDILDTTLKMLGASASPVVLIAIGLFLAKKIKFDWSLAHATIISVLKLAVLPILFILVSKMFSNATNSMAFDLSIIEAGMPVALTNFALAEIYPMDKRIAAKSIIISTILSLFTITILATFAL